MPNKTSKDKNGRIFNEGQSMNKLRSAECGDSALSFGALNPDRLLTSEMKQDSTHQLRTNIIHIAGIQDARITNDATSPVGMCNIYRAAAERNRKYPIAQRHYVAHIGGVAVAIRQELTQHVSTIRQINNRIITVTMQEQTSKTPLTIIVAYAPNQGRK